MNRKRGRARNRRAGCKLCKPWKVNGIRTERVDGEKWSDHRRRELLGRDIDAFEGMGGAKGRRCARVTDQMPVPPA